MWSRDRCDFVPDLLDVSGARFARLNATPLARVVNVQRNAELYDICGIVAKRRLHKLEKAADGGARGGLTHKQHSARHRLAMRCGGRPRRQGCIVMSRT